MPEAERRLLKWLEANMEILICPLIVLGALLLRIPLRSIYAEVPGGRGSSLAMFSDIVPAAAAYLFFYRKGDKAGTYKAIGAAALILLAPSGIFVSSVYNGWLELSTGLCLFAFLFALDNRYVPAFIFLSLGVLFSYEALLFIPFFVFLYLYEKKHSVLLFLMPVLSALFRIATGGTAVESFLGRWIPAGIAERRLYIAQPSFWAFLNGESSEVFGYYFVPLLLIALIILGLILKLLCREGVVYDKNDRLWILCILCFFSALFIPGLDSAAAAAYTLPFLILAIADLRVLPAALLLEYLRVIPLSAAIYGEELYFASMQTFSVVEFIVLGTFIFLFVSRKKILDRVSEI